MSGSFFIAPIVEGHGEVQAVPILLRRLIADAKPNAQLWLNPALRVKAGSFINDDDYFKKYLELAARKTKPWPNSCVLILLDCEDECPAELGPRLLEKARVCRSDVTIIVILAHREYETWFLAAARSLRASRARCRVLPRSSATSGDKRAGRLRRPPVARSAGSTLPCGPEAPSSCAPRLGTLRSAR